VSGRPLQTGVLEGDLIAGLCAALRTSRSGSDVQLIRRAYDVAARCHQGQTRRSGDPYITHPLSVAAILARLGADDQTLCATILHDTIEDTPYTLDSLRREFGAGIATMVADHMTLDRISGPRKMAHAMAAIRSADARVVAVKIADRLHNMQTLECLPQAKQLRKAREVLDIFLPVTQQLSMHAVRSELQALAFATLIRNRSARSPCDRVIVALDIERSTSRPDPVKAELRTMLYELFDAALRSAGIHPRRRDRFIDRGDGLLALIHAVGQAPEALLNRVVPGFSQLLTSYNASLSPMSRPQRQLRVRAVVHTGKVHYDGNGCFGEALDIAFRLLDAPRVKTALKTAQGPLLLVVSGDVYGSVVHAGYDEFGERAFRRLVSAQVAGNSYPGWIHIPAQPLATYGRGGAITGGCAAQPEQAVLSAYAHCAQCHSA